MTRQGLVLPKDAQWEYGCRAGTTTVFWSGDKAADLAGNANVFDQAGARGAPHWRDLFDAFDDGFFMSSPVGSFGANAFGLYDVHGNALEWCRDGPAHAESERNMRGGNFSGTAELLGSGRQKSANPDFLFNSVSLRPARALRLPD